MQYLLISLVTFLAAINAYGKTIENPLNVEIQGKSLKVASAIYVDQNRTRAITSNRPIEVTPPYHIRRVFLDQKHTFNFPWGEMSIEGPIFLHQNGNISIAYSENSTPVQWKNHQRQVSLRCSFVYRNSQRQPGMITFHSNGQLSRGCTTLGDSLFPTKKGFEVLVQGYNTTLDFDQDGHLQYAAKGEINNFTWKNQLIELEPQREIGFHSNGTPHFFTLKDNFKMAIEHPDYGQLLVTNPPNQLASISFTPQGNLQRAYLSNSLEIKGLNHTPIITRTGPHLFHLESDKLRRVEVESQNFKVLSQQNELIIQGLIDLYQSGRIEKLSLPINQTYQWREYELTLGSEIYFHDQDQLRVRAVQLAAPLEVTVGDNHYRFNFTLGFDEHETIRFAQLANKMTVQIKDFPTPLTLEPGDGLIFSENGELISYRPREILQ